MTPNQITGTANALRALLEDGHRQGLLGGEATVITGETVTVRTYWNEPELNTIGAVVTLSATVAPDGTIEPQDAAWNDDARPDPEGRPGVKVLGDGQPYYSAAWLDGHA